MEAVARQFAGGEHALVVRNGWFSYRWTQIFEAGGFAARTTVLKARPQGNAAPAPFAPAPIEEVVAAIRAARPDAVFAPHVETSAGIILPDDYIRALADAAHEVGGAPRARLRRLGLRLGGHGGDRRRRADLGAAEGLVLDRRRPAS